MFISRMDLICFSYIPIYIYTIIFIINIHLNTGLILLYISLLDVKWETHFNKVESF